MEKRTIYPIFMVKEMLSSIFILKISLLVAPQKQPNLLGTMKSSKLLALRSLVYPLMMRHLTKSFVKTWAFLTLLLLILTMKFLKNMAFMDLRNSWDENTWVSAGPRFLLIR